MKKSKKIVSALVSAAILCTLAGISFTSCSSKKDQKGSVRYLNFKPEIADVYAELAQVYEKETGVKVVVETAANNSYESTLMAGVPNAPSIYAPTNNPDLAMQRQMQVLRKMVKYGYKIKFWGGRKIYG